MLTTVHLLSGAAVAVVLKDPLLIAPTVFALHYVLDIVPHYAPSPVNGFKEKGLKGANNFEIFAKGIEPVAGIALVIVLVSLSRASLKLPITVGAFFCWLPDILHFTVWKYDFKYSKIIKELERRYHMTKYHKHIGGVRGILPQSLLATLCLFFLIIKIK